MTPLTILRATQAALERVTRYASVGYRHHGSASLYAKDPFTGERKLHETTRQRLDPDRLKTLNAPPS